MYLEVIPSHVLVYRVDRLDDTSDGSRKVWLRESMEHLISTYAVQMESSEWFTLKDLEPP